MADDRDTKTGAVAQKGPDQKVVSATPEPAPPPVKDDPPAAAVEDTPVESDDAEEGYAADLLSVEQLIEHGDELFGQPGFIVRSALQHTGKSLLTIEEARDAIVALLAHTPGDDNKENS